MRFLDTSGIRTRFDERVRAADGTELSVDLYLPPQRGSYPVLLNRTAEDNNCAAGVGDSLPPAERWKAFAAQGFIVAVADVRGRGDSDGTFAPFVHEANDGASTLAWLRTLQECNGRIGLFGWGYGAFCAWAAAVADANVDAVASMSPFGAVGDGLVHRGGAVRLDWLSWMHLIGGRTLQPANVPPWSEIYKHLPLATMDEALGRDDIWWREWLKHPDPNDAAWAPLHLADRIATLQVPGLHVTGWWDGQAAATHYCYDAARRGGAPQQLIVGPWDTSTVCRPVAQIGGFDFGPRSVLDLDETIAVFFDEQLRGCKAPVVPVRVFVTGRNEWLECEAWPSRVEVMMTLHLGSRLGANTRCGDGELSSSPAQPDAVDAVTHDPAVPVVFQPYLSSLDQTQVTSRDEALVYTSAPLERAVAVFGHPKITLTVRTNAADADLYVLISDSFPLGTRDLHLGHAALRLATLRSFVPGEWMTVELQADAICHEFMPGHRIRLTITPSLFPLYARNVQSGSYATGSALEVADIELCSGGERSAFVTLPVYES